MVPRLFQRNLCCHQIFLYLIFFLILFFFDADQVIFARVNPDKDSSSEGRSSRAKKEIFLPLLEKEFWTLESLPDIILESADEGQFLSMERGGEGIILLEGRVHIRMGERSIFADRVTINSTKGEIFGRGNIRLEEGEQILRGESFYFDQKTGQGVLYKTNSYIPPFYYSGKMFRKVNSELVIMDEGDISTCDLDLPHYRFLVKKIWLYGDRKVFAREVTLEVGSTPVFYLPFIYQTTEGSGVITQLGYTDRRGYFLQNTVNLSFEAPQLDNEKGTIQTKWVADFYQRNGQYISMFSNIKYPGFSWDNKIGFAYFHPIDYDPALGRYKNLSESSDLSLPGDTRGIITEKWYSFRSKLASKLFSDPWGEHSISYDLKWYRHAYMVPFFENRNEPSSTMDLINKLFINETIKSPLYNLNWYASYQRKSDNSILVATFKRKWQWDKSKTFLSGKATYLPLEEAFPEGAFQYSDDFIIGNEDFFQKFQYGLDVAGSHLRNFDRFGSEVYEFWRSNGFAYMNTNFSFFSSWLNIVPQMGYGYTRELPIDPTQSQRFLASKNSYQFYETKLNSRIGQGQIYLNNDYVFRRSFSDKYVEKPFFHERVNKLISTFVAAPITDLVFNLTSAYDFRPGFERKENRWSDLVLSSDWVINFFNFNDSGKIGFYDKYRLIFSRLHIKTSYYYILRFDKPGIMESTFTYEAGNFSFLFLNRVREISVGLRFYENFKTEMQTRLYLVWKIHTEVARYWTFELGGNSTLDKLFRTEANIAGESVSLLNYNVPREGFRVESFYLNIVHDLHCWEFLFSWKITQDTIPFGVKLNHRLVYYEQIFYFGFRNKDVTSVGIPNTEIYRFKTDADAFN